MKEMWVQSLSQEDPHGVGNGNQLHYSCPENPMDSGAWWATVHEVVKDAGITQQLNHHPTKTDNFAIIIIS